MAHAIKQISVARGHDVTGYALACFGGAGGQHACLVADALAIGTVLIHPLAGVLSAYGMGLAERGGGARADAGRWRWSLGLKPRVEQAPRGTGRSGLRRSSALRPAGSRRRVFIRRDGSDNAIELQPGPVDCNGARRSPGATARNSAMTAPARW